MNGTSWELREGIKDNSYSMAGGKPYPGQLKYECDENGNPIKQKLGNTVAPLTGGFGLMDLLETLISIFSLTTLSEIRL